MVVRTFWWLSNYDTIKSPPLNIFKKFSRIQSRNWKTITFGKEHYSHQNIDSIDISNGEIENYDTTYSRFWSLINLDNGDTIINNETDISSEVQHVVDGFIPSFSGAKWEIEEEDSSSFIPFDQNTASSVVFNGLGHPSATEKTWKSYLNTLPASSVGELGANPKLSDLWNDLELRFTQGGSVASYYNILTLYGMQDIDTVLVPFELWDIENNRQINLSIYQ